MYSVSLMAILYITTYVYELLKVTIVVVACNTDIANRMHFTS